MMDFMILDGTSASSKPSIFELLALEKMNSLLEPAFEYTITKLTERYYSLLPLHRWRKGLYLVIMSAIEYQYLSDRNSSFSESFYGLKRRLVGKSKRPKLVTLFNIFELVIAPMIKSNMDQLYDSIETTRNFQRSEDTNTSLVSRLKKCFIEIYPAIRFLISITFFGFQLGYVSNIVELTSPWQLINNQRLSRMNNQDFQLVDEKIKSQRNLLLRSLHNVSKISYILRIIQYAAVKILRSISLGLPLGIYVFQFIEWWNVSENKHRKPSTPIPRPPPPITPHKNGLHVLAQGKCSICKNSVVNPAMLYGYVHCYTCIYNQVTENMSCPITFKIADVTKIRKIYIG
jgi:peroxin-12